MRVQNSGNFGDIKNLTLKIDGKDFTQSMNLIEIFQDIFTPCWTATVTINDTTNLIMRMPIKPGSELTISVETDVKSPALDGDKEYSFIIYKIDDREHQGQMQQQYKLYCATSSYIRNQSVRIQKCYSDMKPEAMVSNIVSEFLGGKVDSVESDNNYHVIIPNWTPFVSAWWCAKIAIKNNAADYIFFMKDFDQYWFKSVEELYKNEKTGVTFKQKPVGFRNDAGDYDDDYCIMINKYIFDHYDGMNNLGNGYYKSKLLTYDVIHKKWESKTFTFGDDIEDDKEKKPWETALFDGAEEANVSFLPKHPGLHENQTIDDQVSNWHPSRKSRLMVLEQNKLRLQIPGGARCWEWLGRTCDIDLPSQQDFDESEKLDKYFKGTYLVTHIYHQINQSYYTTNLECNKIRLEEKMK